MKNSKITRGILICLCALTLTGCSAKNTRDRSSQGDTPDTPAAQSSTVSDDTESTDANELIDSAAMQGSVIDFSSNGCSVSQVTSEDGGKSSKISAPGSENADTTVNIKYQTNCTFQRAVINRTTENAAISAASVSDIKKQTSLIIYGDFEDTHNLTAAKVIVVRYE